MRILTDAVMLLFLLCCSYCDLEKRSVPVWLLCVYSVVSIVAACLSGESSFGTAAAGAAIGLMFLIISRVTKEVIGYGDSWLILILGIYLGGEKLLWLLFVASFCAGVISLFRLWRTKWKGKETLPFIPYLTAAFVGVMLSCV